MTGRIMMEIVKAPESIEKPNLSAVTKNSMPKSPYTIDGIPASVSAFIRIIRTSLLPRLAYSTR